MWIRASHTSFEYELWIQALNTGLVVVIHPMSEASECRYATTEESDSWR